MEAAEDRFPYSASIREESGRIQAAAGGADGAESLQESLLAELRALDDERVRYQLEHPTAPLGMEDPDVRRLIEALAYSAVRTRQATMRNLFSTWKRLLSGYFHFMLQPLPAMTMVQTVVTPQMTDTVTVQRGSSLQLSTLEGTTWNFQTLAELRVVPINLARTELQMNRGGYRLVMTFCRCISAAMIWERFRSTSIT